MYIPGTCGTCVQAVRVVPGTTLIRHVDYTCSKIKFTDKTHLSYFEKNILPQE